jgi:hypothetical protein
MIKLKDGYVESIVDIQNHKRRNLPMYVDALIVANFLKSKSFVNEPIENSF